MKKIFLSLFILTIIISCSEEDTNGIYAGKTKNLHHYNCEPAIMINYLKLSDSIDFNEDGSYDITFTFLHVPSTTGYYLFPVIKPKNNFQIQISKLNNLPDTINFGDPITKENIWSDTEEKWVSIYTLKLSKYGYFVPDGCWLNIDDKYIGIKNNDKYGWVRMAGHFYGNNEFIIKEYAFEK